jgi:NO-binding membrane sensor protein with MHYT domain
MFRVFSCLTTHHDYWLVGLAALVCISTTLSSFRIYYMALQSRDVRKLGWAGITGVCAGSGIWATHFVDMLAYNGGFPIAYDPVVTLISWSSQSRLLPADLRWRHAVTAGP